MDITTLNAGVRYTMRAVGDVRNLPAYLALTNPQNCRTNVTNALTLNSLGTVDQCVVNMTASLVGYDYIMCAISFTPTANVDVGTVGAKILYGMQYDALQGPIANSTTIGAGDAIPIPHLSDSAYWGSISIPGGYVVEPGSIHAQAANSQVDTVRTPLAPDLLGATTTWLATNHSTDPAVDGHDTLANALPGLPSILPGAGAINWTAIEVALGAVLTIALLVAAGYAVRSVYRA